MKELKQELLRFLSIAIPYFTGLFIGRLEITGIKLFLLLTLVIAMHRVILNILINWRKP